MPDFNVAVPLDKTVFESLRFAPVWLGRRCVKSVHKGCLLIQEISMRSASRCPTSPMTLTFYTCLTMRQVLTTICAALVLVGELAEHAPMFQGANL